MTTEQNCCNQPGGGRKVTRLTLTLMVAAMGALAYVATHAVNRMDEPVTPLAISDQLAQESTPLKRERVASCLKSLVDLTGYVSDAGLVRCAQEPDFNDKPKSISDKVKPGQMKVINDALSGIGNR